MRVHHQAAYILLNRPYSETSFIVEVFSKNYGRLSLIAKGARRQKSPWRGMLLAFQPLSIAWSGKGEVPTLTNAEIDLRDYRFGQHELSGDALVCGFYCNELLVNLLHRYDPHPALFAAYHRTILRLQSAAQGTDLPALLREFEQTLIKEAGYAVNFDLEASGQGKIEDRVYYRFVPNQGFVRVASAGSGCYQGKVIRSLINQLGAPLNASELSQAKALMRDILQQTLNHRKIVSRDLFFPKQRLHPEANV